MTTDRRVFNPQYRERLFALVDGAPFVRHMGMRIIDLAWGRATFDLTAAEFRLQPLGVVHGGNIATLIDTATFWACFLAMDSDDDGLASVDLKLNYLAPARVEALRCTGNVDQGRQDHLLRRGGGGHRRQPPDRPWHVHAHAPPGSRREARDSALGGVGDAFGTIRDMLKRLVCGLIAVLASSGATVAAQKSARAASPPLPSLPVTLFTSELPVRVTAVATGLSHPWSLNSCRPLDSARGTWRDDARDRARRTAAHHSRRRSRSEARRGRARRLQRAARRPARHRATPEVSRESAAVSELLEGPGDKRSTTVLARARWTGRRSRISRTSSSPTRGASRRPTSVAASPSIATASSSSPSASARSRSGRRIPAITAARCSVCNDDGTVPADNPFVGRAGYLPEIYSLGHRSPQGLAMHPTTGAIWETEHGPLGGDEINILKPGRTTGGRW